MKTCANCRYGVTVTTQADPAMVPTSTTTCHATPPAAAANGNAIWPAVSPNDWCGAYVSGDVFPQANS